MSDTLHDDLTDISGIGDARAEQILAVVDEHRPPADDSGVPAELADAIRDADELLAAGNARYARNHTRRALEFLADDD